MRNRPILISILTAVASPALACPVCDTANGQKVRAAITGGELGLGLLATLLPFALMLSIATMIHVGLPAARREDDTRN